MSRVSARLIRIRRTRVGTCRRRSAKKRRGWHTRVWPRGVCSHWWRRWWLRGGRLLFGCKSPCEFSIFLDLFLLFRRRSKICVWLLSRQQWKSCCISLTARTPRVSLNTYICCPMIDSWLHCIKCGCLVLSAARKVMQHFIYLHSIVYRLLEGYARFP